MREFAVKDRWVVFGLPGQPMYRAYLGRAVPPPRVRFSGFSSRAPLMPEDLLALLGGPGETSDQRLDGLEDRVGRFRRAERAVALGLAATAFEPVTV